MSVRLSGQPGYLRLIPSRRVHFLSSEFIKSRDLRPDKIIQIPSCGNYNVRFFCERVTCIQLANHQIPAVKSGWLYLRRRDRALPFFQLVIPITADDFML